jgi:hypothetical protein
MPTGFATIPTDLVLKQIHFVTEPTGRRSEKRPKKENRVVSYNLGTGN